MSDLTFETKYVIRVDGPGTEGAIYLDEEGNPTPDRKKRDSFDTLDDVCTVVDNVRGQCGLEAARVVRLVPKKPRVEYATTTAAGVGYGAPQPPAPCEPDGSGWVLVGTAATSPTNQGDRLYWTWKREAKSKP